MAGFPRRTSAKDALENGILNPNPSLAGTTQNATGCIGFENSRVEQMDFGDLVVASHETGDLVCYYEKASASPLSSWVELSISFCWLWSTGRPEVKQI